MDEKGQMFSTLKQLADLVTRMFGDNCEIAIHDLTSENKGLIYITGDVTRRELGSPVTDAVVKYLARDGNNVADRHCFMTLTDDGRELKSSTSYIKDSTGKVVAAFCINFNTTDHHNAIQLLESFVNRGMAGDPGMDEPEKISFSIDNTMGSLFEGAVGEIGKRPASMTTNEKIRLVKILETKGAFQIRGVVSQVALRLGVSNFTIYNYLKKIRAAKGTEIMDII
jgi:predicted transcriptional regulator YheO